jgi:hypothetical protein
MLAPLPFETDQPAEAERDRQPQHGAQQNQQVRDYKQA